MKNNRSNQTRSQRNRNSSNNNRSTLETIYYAVIGILLVILIGLVIFIFVSRNGDDGEIADDGAPDEEVIPDDNEDIDDPSDNGSSDDETPGDEVGNDPDDIDDEDIEDIEDPEEPEEPDDPADNGEDPGDDGNNGDEDNSDDMGSQEPIDPDEEYVVEEDAPIDESYVPDFNDGSSDRQAISQATSQVTGLGVAQMTTWWVGNNGPGRVFTIVSNSNQSEVYRLELQYGEGSWHVTSVEQLPQVPSDYQ